MTSASRNDLVATQSSWWRYSISFTEFAYKAVVTKIWEAGWQMWDATGIYGACACSLGYIMIMMLSGLQYSCIILPLDWRALDGSPPEFNMEMKRVIELLYLEGLIELCDTPTSHWLHHLSIPAQPLIISLNPPEHLSRRAEVLISTTMLHIFIIFSEVPKLMCLC